MRFKTVGLAAALPMILPTPLLAAGLGCPPGARPLIKQLNYFAYSAPATPHPHEVRDAILICSQGTVLKASHSGPTGFKIPESAAIVRGTASKEAMDELRAAMADARIGFHKDCNFLGTTGVAAGAKIEWFGAGRRVNSFLLSPEILPLPPCDPPTWVLFNALDSVVGSVSESADRERVDFP